MQFLADNNIDATLLMQLFTSLFMGILFIQSGLDKVFNYQGEKSFYTSHFSKSVLKNTVGLLMPTITIAELAAGFLSGIGFVLILINGHTGVAELGMLCSALSICMLFFGQRMAKDYAGSAVLVPYFLVALVGLYFYSV